MLCYALRGRKEGGYFCVFKLNTIYNPTLLFGTYFTVLPPKPPPPPPTPAIPLPPPNTFASASAFFALSLSSILALASCDERSKSHGRLCCRR